MTSCPNAQAVGVRLTTLTFSNYSTSDTVQLDKNLQVVENEESSSSLWEGVGYVTIIARNSDNTSLRLSVHPPFHAASSSAAPQHKCVTPASVKEHLNPNTKFHCFLPRSQSSTSTGTRGTTAQAVQKCKAIWQQRKQRKHRQTAGEVSWAESRFARITGATARGVVNAGHRNSETVLQAIFGRQAPPTWQMQLGATFESQVLDLYYQATQKIRQKNRAGLVVHTDLPYVGHTPDGLTSNPARVLQEVKVVFWEEGKAIDMEAQKRKHFDQIQLGMAVHNCETCDLIVYKCPPTEGLATRHKLDKNNMSILTIPKQARWWDSFKVHAHAFYTAHLEWMYAAEFSEEAACRFFNTHPQVAANSALFKLSDDGQ